MKAALPRVLEDLLNLPTAAFVETAVLAYIESAASVLPHTSLQRDQHGNLLVHYRHPQCERGPIALTAHTDHPGFVALRMLDKRTLLAAFRGWVEPQYFDEERVRFWSGGCWVKGRVEKITKAAPVFGMIGRTGRPEEVTIRVKREIEPNAPGMWNLPDARLRDGVVRARGCDDVAGVAALLAMFQRLAKRSAPANVMGLFTRAEEVGFVGAIGAARSGTIPPGTPIIAIETSKQLPNARIGDGPIVRVGDKTTIFAPHVTAFADRVARELVARTTPPARGNKPAPKNPRPTKTPRGRSRKAAPFRYQRRLMDGGTCETTAFGAYGYAAGGICVALGNYHNMNEKRGRIDSEYISLSDWEHMVTWFEALACDPHGPGAEGADLRTGLDKRFAEYEPLLRGA
ncbi:MAG: hypothetical protein IPM64_11665 [Phycisphaerales bacterium]|nr:hypothetical protein [Phycisphaerales bacterium]